MGLRQGVRGLGKRLKSSSMTLTMSRHLMVCDEETCDVSPLVLPDPTWPERTIRNWSEDQGWRNDDEDHDYCPSTDPPPVIGATLRHRHGPGLSSSVQSRHLALEALDEDR